jgi:hypothetical protein
MQITQQARRSKKPTGISLTTIPRNGYQQKRKKKEIKRRKLRSQSTVSEEGNSNTTLKCSFKNKRDDLEWSSFENEWNRTVHKKSIAEIRRKMDYANGYTRFHVNFGSSRLFE